MSEVTEPNQTPTEAGAGNKSRSVLGKGLASLLPGANLYNRESSTETQKAVNESIQPPPAPFTAAPVAPVSAQDAAQPPQPEPAKEPAREHGAGATLASAEDFGDRIPGITLASVDLIRANPFQPRRDFDDQSLEELAQSIRELGIIQPLIVRKAEKGYELIAGERRLRAARKAGILQVPIVVKRTTDKESLELALVENVQRQDLNCIDEALSYQQLVEDFSLTQEEIAKRVGKDRASVANSLRLLKLSQEMIQDLRRGRLSHGHGKALLSVEDPGMRNQLRQEIIERNLSVRAAEARAQEMKRSPSTSTTASDSSNDGDLTGTQKHLNRLAVELTRTLSSRVEIKGSERRGKIVLHYRSRQDLDRLLESLQNHH